MPVAHARRHCVLDYFAILADELRTIAGSRSASASAC